jgi:asparagine synthase (glutamine-hydrolysing)
MCGISGCLKFENTQLDTRATVANMVSHLRHRGPDDHGVESDSTVALGQTRLSIIDLSAAGHQPMVSPTGELSITYNGEVYNYRQVRQQLPSQEWQSQSDTEVILRAYAAWGPDCVKHLRGMFAFAIWDRTQGRLFIARDRLGIKPVYYYSSPASGCFLFASEVRALLASGLVPRRLDPVALSQFLSYQSVPAPRTLIEGVRSLPPGCWLSVGLDGSVVQQRYWDLLANSAPEAADDGGRRLPELLRESMELHQVSDVPVAAFLSGGIDSSAVVGLMRATGAVPRTFSVGFAEQAYDETAYARTVAERFGAEHTEVRLGESELLQLLPDAVAAMDQPTGDGVNTYVIARAVHEAGIKVALSGLGGDELFAGYPSFARLRRATRVLGMWGRAPSAVRTLAAAGVRGIGRSSIAATKSAALISSNGRLAELYPPLRQVLAPHQVQALLTPTWAEMGCAGDPYVHLLDEAFSQCGDSDRFVSRVSYAEARTYMHDVLLRDTDQMSMAHALEVRVPLLDHVLAEYVLGLADQYKAPDGTPKRLLVDSLHGLLPDEVVHRKKQGFTLPFDPWLRGQLREYCEERLAPDRLGGRGIFQSAQLQRLWHSFLDGNAGVSWSRIWVLVVLEDWLERNSIPSAN